MLTPKVQFTPVNDIDMAYYEWGKRQPGAPSLLFVHATGFHGRVWDSIVEQFPDYHCVSIDQRCHGYSSAPAINHWKILGEDLLQFAHNLNLSNVLGIGHSLGGHTILDAAALGEFCAALLLLDPVIFEPEAYRPGGEQSDLSGVTDHPVARRKDTFSSVNEFAERLANKSSFPKFTPRAFADYCEHALVQKDDGLYHLACPPMSEACFYLTSHSNARIHDHIRSLEVPTLVVRAQRADRESAMDFGNSPTWPELADRLPNGRDLHWANCSHFIPMERPGDVARLLRDQLETIGSPV